MFGGYGRFGGGIFTFAQVRQNDRRLVSADFDGLRSMQT